MPNYSKAGKILIPLTEGEFQEGMRSGHFCQDKHRGFAALLYYTGIRVSEALRAKRGQFSLQNNRIFFDVLKRLKHGIKTPELEIPLSRSFAFEIWSAVEATKKKKRVWPYSRMTGYNIISRVWSYPHHFRLTRITDLFNKGFTVPEIQSYTGLTLLALNYYIGRASIRKMGEA